MSSRDYTTLGHCASLVILRVAFKVRLMSCRSKWQMFTSKSFGHLKDLRIFFGTASKLKAVNSLRTNLLDQV